MFISSTGMHVLGVAYSIIGQRTRKVNRYQYPRQLPTSLGTAFQILPEKAHRCSYGA